MKKLLRLFFPLSLRVRFLLATAAVVLVLSLAYGMVALIGYSVSFDKLRFGCYVAKAICSIPLRSGKTISCMSSYQKISTSKAPP